MKISCTGPTGITEEFVKESNRVLIGRELAPAPDRLGLRDGEVSGRHAMLVYEGGEFWIEDLDSTNGTWVDKKRIKAGTRTRLAPGAGIRIGRTTLLVDADVMPAPAPGLRGAAAGPKDKPLESVDAGQSIADLFMAGGSIESVRNRLALICGLSESMAAIETVESMAACLQDHLLRAFSKTGRGGHCGLLLGPDLILKSFRPDDQPPTCSLTLARHAQEKKQACLWRIDATEGFDQSASMMQSGIQSAMYAPLVWKGEVLGVLYLDADSRKTAFDRDDLHLMQAIAGQAAMFIKNLSLQQTMQREAVVKTRLLAQFPQQIAERLARQPGSLSIVSERVETVTVLFSDVRGFTRMSAAMEPEQVVQMLNDMFHDLTPIVLKYGGTVDKYIGDAILAVFGSPDPDKDQWEHAVRAAMDMQASMAHLASGRWKGRAPFEVGIGIHTGPAIHGFIGAPERMEYTVIGGTINSASRYCAGAGPGEVLISPETYARLHQYVDVELPPREIETKHEGRIKAYCVRKWTGARKR